MYTHPEVFWILYSLYETEISCLLLKAMTDHVISVVLLTGWGLCSEAAGGVWSRMLHYCCWFP